MDCSRPGYSVHGVFQARVLEWVAISFSRRSYWPQDRTPVSCIAGKFFTAWATKEAPKTSASITNLYSPRLAWAEKGLWGKHRGDGCPDLLGAWVPTSSLPCMDRRAWEVLHGLHCLLPAWEKKLKSTNVTAEEADRTEGTDHPQTHWIVSLRVRGLGSVGTRRGLVERNSLWFIAHSLR